MLSARKLLIEPKPPIGANNAINENAKFSSPNEFGPKQRAANIKPKKEKINPNNLTTICANIENLNDEKN